MTNKNLLSIAIVPLFMALGLINTTVPPPMEDSSSVYTYKCVIHIKDGNKNPVTDVEVYANICGGIVCGGKTASIRPDANGVVTFTWDGGPETTGAILAQGGDCYLCTIYLNDTEYKGEFRDRGIHTLVYPPVVQGTSGPRKRRERQ